ncbi:hypothetical protein [Planococcus versutus]|uniref:Sigma-X negative effector n=1 Tax=Planococcus versutus TaxID=1302659 RepID=A0A1B1S4E7_9BACL|nr:hypothetical protein [Planococcus versutus]ANU28070.1 hypothetical protein I858_013840 [Planococcus versutus]
MPNNKWTDDAIEDLLKEFPEIKDNRSKKRVYNQLVQRKSVKKPRKPWLPILIAALAFIAMGILVSSIISQNGIDFAQTKNDSSDAADESSATMKENNELSEVEDSNESESDQFSTAQVEDTVRTAVYESEISDQTVMTIGLTVQAIVVPVTFLIPAEEIASDFKSLVPTSLELYQKYADDINEKALGFDNYHPYIGTLEKTTTGIRHMLPQDHQYDKASASIGIYFNTLSASFNDADQIEVVNKDGSAAEFSQIGPVESRVPTQENLAYYSVAAKNGDIYLAPGYDMPFASVSEAISSLTKSPSDLYSGTIPEDLVFQVIETDKLVTVRFETEVDLNAINQLDAVRMIESLTLTANSFHKEAKIEGLQPVNWNGFDFSLPLPIPIAPNLLEWTAQ